MKKTSDIGKEGEDLACNYLIAEGFVINERNWRYGKLEVDIIAMRNAKLHFIEVKTRSGVDSDEAINAVNMAKQRNLIAAANAYLLQLEDEPEVSFDIITVRKWQGVQHVEYIPDAFYPV